MKLAISLSLVALVLPVLSGPLDLKRQTGVPDAATITHLAPELEFHSGVNPTGTGDCDGAVDGADGKPNKIPCTCPPPQDVYLDVRDLLPPLQSRPRSTDISTYLLQALVKNVQAGIAVNNTSVNVAFPTDNSNQSQSARITAALITLQNLNGPGKGCPAASTTLVARQKALGT